MGRITNKMVETSYKIGRRIYNNKLAYNDGLSELINIGMNNTSADFYIKNYKNLRQAKLFTRTMNNYGVDYYLKMIFKEWGEDGLCNALLALSQHIDYYEEKSGSNAKGNRDIYEKYISFLSDKPVTPIYPDEVDNEVKYAEGKTKKVLVNAYERNPIARKKCIEYYGVDCQICGFNFEKVYGSLGKEFIHVHHKIDISIVGTEYSVDPITDLIPVCPNCHSMLHKKKPAYSVERLKKWLEKENNTH